MNKDGKTSFLKNVFDMTLEHPKLVGAYIFFVALVMIAPKKFESFIGWIFSVAVGVYNILQVPGILIIVALIMWFGVPIYKKTRIPQNKKNRRY